MILLLLLGLLRFFLQLLQLLGCQLGELVGVGIAGRIDQKVGSVGGVVDGLVPCFDLFHVLRLKVFDSAFLFAVPPHELASLLFHGLKASTDRRDVELLAEVELVDSTSVLESLLGLLRLLLHLLFLLVLDSLGYLFLYVRV